MAGLSIDKKQNILSILMGLTTNLYGMLQEEHYIKLVYLTAKDGTTYYQTKQAHIF
jgi:hypothetical protein